MDVRLASVGTGTLPSEAIAIYPKSKKRTGITLLGLTADAKAKEVLPPTKLPLCHKL